MKKNEEIDIKSERKKKSEWHMKWMRDDIEFWKSEEREKIEFQMYLHIEIWKSQQKIDLICHMWTFPSNWLSYVWVLDLAKSYFYSHNK
jgi:hypothetical protein